MHKLRGGRDTFMVCVITVRWDIKKSSILRLEDAASLYENTFLVFYSVLLHVTVFSVHFSFTRFTQFVKSWFFSVNVGKSNICCVTPSEVCRQPVLIQCATERHSSSALGPCAIIWEGKKIGPRSWNHKWVWLAHFKVLNEGWHKSNLCSNGARLCVKRHSEKCSDSRATVKLLSVLVTSHAERVCGEDRRALCVLHTLSASGQSAKNRAESVETLSVALLFCGQSPGVCWGIEYLIRNSARPPAISAVRTHRENWRGETTCCEYRWEQLLTPPAHRSAVRLDKAKRTSLRRIQFHIGLSVQAVSHSLPVDAYLRGSVSYLFCSIPEVKTGCLPSVILEAHRKPIEPKKKNPKSGETHLWLWHAVSCFVWTGPILWRRCIRDSPGRSIRPIPSRTHLRPATFSVDRLQTRRTRRKPLSNSSTANLTSSTARNACRRMRM